MAEHEADAPVLTTAAGTAATLEGHASQGPAGLIPAVAGEATSAELLRSAIGCVDAGGYLQLGSLFFAVSAQGATIDRIVLAGSLEDIPAVDSDQWRSLGYTSPDGMFAAHHCHRLKKPAPQQPSGLWSRFTALFHDDPRPHPLAERWDCRGGLRFLRVGGAGDAGGAAGEGRLIFEYDGIEFGLNPRADPTVAAHVQLPEGAALADLPLLVPELAAEERQDNGSVAAPGRDDEADAAGAAGAAGEEGSGCSRFRVGGINTQQAIEAALQVGGTGFAELSERMQPSSSHLKRDDEWRDYSAVGFLKRGGGLKAQLLADNALVLGQGSSDMCCGSGSSPAAAGKGKLAMMPLAPSHQALVGPLLKATRLHRAASCRLGVWVLALRFRHRGGRFVLLHEHASGCQQSPFMDGTSSGQHFCLVNEGTGARVGFEGLAPVMAFRYGFYQGGRYRLDPAAVRRVLSG
jgi:hypothetical protein